MRKSRFIQPYKKKRTSFPETKGKSGVYLIKENDKLVYVGYSGNNLYRTMYRHFESWSHKSQEVVTYAGKLRNRYLVRVILCTAAQAARLERMLIIKHLPRDNENKYRNYQLDLRDKKVYQEYTSIPVENIEVPF